MTEARRRPRVLLWLTGATVVLALASVLFPQIDLIVMRWFFHTGGNDFVLHGDPLSARYRAYRDLAVKAFFAFLLLATVAAGLGRPILGLDWRRLLAVWTTILVTVGLIVNVILKNGFGRPRPDDVRAFGGELPFHPPWLPGGACGHNCSFVSGDVAMAFVALAFALMARPGWPRRLAVAGTLALGGFVGTMRMLTGSHFPSDVLFAGLLTSLSVLVLDELLLRRRVPLPRVDRQRMRAWLLRLGPGRKSAKAARWRNRGRGGA